MKKVMMIQETCECENVWMQSKLLEESLIVSLHRVGMLVSSYEEVLGTACLGRPDRRYSGIAHCSASAAKPVQMKKRKGRKMMFVPIWIVDLQG